MVRLVDENGNLLSEAKYDVDGEVQLRDGTAWVVNH